MKIQVFALFVVLIPLISAQNIEINYPEEIAAGEEFEINLKLINFESDTYDIKIDITLNEERISQIWNTDKFQSTHYYVKDIIEQDEEKDFLLKTSLVYGEAEIIVKTRDSNEDVLSFGPYYIDVEEQLEEIVEEKEENKETELEELKYSEEQDNEVIEKDITPKPVETINLNPQSIKTEENSSTLEKQDYAKYGLIAFCFLLGILFILKRKNKNGLE